MAGSTDAVLRVGGHAGRGRPPNPANENYATKAVVRQPAVSHRSDDCPDGWALCVV
jgi:hypothetical protein